ncbi:succinate dehydrogenase assembly factor 2 [Aestuariibacter salexigens]|uniref:FAD assembly factor SdhE n=1 Tax=Aestuariibacter salexigens TaxID=226010 RepID=UPI00041B502F|nr:succinate dehydrogenase assembly factor 2 [Aestuariibacter salexigens]
MFDDKRKARMKWACRRGMLELDVLLTRFYDNAFDELTDEQLEVFENLLTCDDPDLFAWFMGHQRCEDEKLKGMIDLVLSRAEL